MKQSLTTAPALCLAALLAACGGSEENARPDPVQMSQFKQGNTRIDVITAVGKPEMTMQRAGRPCDVYKLYTTGLTAGGKAAMALGEGVTDVATLGLAEIGWSAVHAGTRPRLHTVLFCYGAPPNGETLVDVYDKDPSRDQPPKHTVIDVALYNTPITVQAPAPTPAPAPASPAAGTISLNNVSREATGGSAAPNTTINPNASSDDLNNISAAKASAANAASFPPPSPAQAATPYAPAPGAK